MQYRIASAALAALAVSSVNAGLISRQNALVIQPGYIVTPAISFNFQNLGAEALAYQTLAQLRDDLSRTAALVVELNKAATTVAADKQAQAQAVVKQVQANADAIRAKLEQLTAELLARANGGGGGGNGGGAPGAPAIPSVAVPSVALPGVPSVA
ncbi:Periaxin, partial [Colletotrichum sp. SAR 10_70]